MLPRRKSSCEKQALGAASLGCLLIIDRAKYRDRVCERCSGCLYKQSLFSSCHHVSHQLLLFLFPSFMIKFKSIRREVRGILTRLYSCCVQAVGRLHTVEFNLLQHKSQLHSCWLFYRCSFKHASNRGLGAHSLVFKAPGPVSEPLALSKSHLNEGCVSESEGRSLLSHYSVTAALPGKIAWSLNLVLFWEPHTLRVAPRSLSEDQRCVCFPVCLRLRVSAFSRILTQYFSMLPGCVSNERTFSL